jgi:hypothetical protein
MIQPPRRLTGADPPSRESQRPACGASAQPGLARLVRDIAERAARDEHREVLLVARLFQHVVERRHAVAIAIIGIGAMRQQLGCRLEVALLDRVQERRFVD